MTTPKYGSWSARAPRENMTTTITPLDTKGPKRLWNAPAGFVVRERGDVDGLVTLEYLCPVHGRFEARVPRAESPDEMPCSELVERYDGVFRSLLDECGLRSPWSPSTFHAWQSSGMVKS